MNESIRNQIALLVVRELRAEGLNGTSGLNRVAEKIAGGVLEIPGVRDSWAAAWDEGADASCIVFRDQKGRGPLVNPYRETARAGSYTEADHAMYAGILAAAVAARNKR